jgi:hypothetical protein
MKLAKDKVSFSIRLAAFQASGAADTRNLKPYISYFTYIFLGCLRQHSQIMPFTSPFANRLLKSE